MRDDRERAKRAFQNAILAEARGDVEAAAMALAEAVMLAPARAKWHHRLGMLRGKRCDWAGAIASFEEAVGLDPARPSWWYRLGQAREARWDYAGAWDAYARAVRMAPDRVRWAERLTAARQAAERFLPFDGVVVAHRGRVGGDVENVSSGIGDLPTHVGGVEVDVRLSRDGVPMLIHDRWVDRTTDGYGAVEELSAVEIAALVPRGGNGSVPTLAEYLDRCAGNELERLQTILVDVKSPTQPTLQQVASTVRMSPVAKRCVVMVRTGEQLQALREVAEDLRLGCFGKRLGNVAERISAARACEAELLLVDHGDRRYLRNRAAIAEVRAAGLRAGASTINTRRALEAAREDRCDVLLTDLADQLSHFVGKPA